MPPRIHRSGLIIPAGARTLGDFAIAGPSPWIDPSNSKYGADPTGATLSTLALQHAINDAVSLGIGTLYIAGNYLSGPLTGGSGIKIFGPGTIKLANGSNQPLLTLTNATNFSLRGVTLDGNGTNQTGYIAGNLYLNGCSAFDLEGIKSKNALNNEIYLQQCYDFEVTHTRIENFVNGIYLDGSYKGSVRGVTGYGTGTAGNSGPAVTVDGVTNSACKINVSDVNVDTCNGAVFMASAYDCHAENLACTNVMDIGADLEWCTDCTIDGFEFDGALAGYYPTGVNIGDSYRCGVANGNVRELKIGVDIQGRSNVVTVENVRTYQNGAIQAWHDFRIYQYPDVPSGNDAHLLNTDATTNYDSIVLINCISVNSAPTQAAFSCVNDGGATNQYGVTLIGCEVRDGQGDGFSVGLDHVRLIGCKVKKTAGYGYVLSGVDATKITDCVAIDCAKGPALITSGYTGSAGPWPTGPVTNTKFDSFTAIAETVTNAYAIVEDATAAHDRNIAWDLDARGMTQGAFQTSGPLSGVNRLIGGGLDIHGIGSPSAPTVTPTGGTGTTTYSYQIVAYDAKGNETTGSVTTTITNGVATLSGTEYNAISWTALPGAAMYRVIRTAGGPSQGAIALTGALSLNDTGIAATGFSGVPIDQTGNTSLNGTFTSLLNLPLQIGTLAVNSTTPSVNGSPIYKSANTAATSITNFGYGTVGQELTVQFGDANTTLVNGANISLAGAVNFTGAIGNIIHFWYDGTVWHEMYRRTT